VTDPPVAPPAPEAPPLGLPETGSSNTITMLLGALLLLGGTGLLGFVRRRTVK
jgi:LPXTG-motif cell wall-anchored protein